jgi:hypothetical protein
MGSYAVLVEFSEYGGGPIAINPEHVIAVSHSEHGVLIVLLDGAVYHVRGDDYRTVIKKLSGRLVPPAKTPQPADS